MAEAQVAQANHETHGVNHTWTKHLLPAGGGVAAVQLYAGLAALHQRGTKERPRTKKTWSVRCNSLLHGCCCWLAVAPLASNETAWRIGAIAFGELDPDPFRHNCCPCQAGRSCVKREPKRSELGPWIWRRMMICSWVARRDCRLRMRSIQIRHTCSCTIRRIYSEHVLG